MATFSNTTSPTPFGFYDQESTFKTEADNIVTFDLSTKTLVRSHRADNGI